VCGLDLAEADPSKERQDQEPRAGECPEAVQAEQGRKTQGDPAVKAEKWRASGEHAHADRQTDLAWRRALAASLVPELPGTAGCASSASLPGYASNRSAHAVALPDRSGRVDDRRQ